MAPQLLTSGFLGHKSRSSAQLYFDLVEKGKSIEENSKIMVKMFDSIGLKVFDLDLKVKIVKEKRQIVFPQKKHGLFSSKLEFTHTAKTFTLYQSYFLLFFSVF